jgi:hypothetical protein
MTPDIKAIAQGESEPVANLRRWMSGPELGAPERVIYAVKVLDAGRALPMGSYDMYLQQSLLPPVSDYVPLTDETLLGIAAAEDCCVDGKPLIAMLRGEIIVGDYQSRLLVLLRAIERAVRGVG